MFKKYPSLENHYRVKEINWWLERFPELKDETFIIQEKLHGCNIQVVFDGKLTLYSRRQKITNDFRGIRGVIKEMGDFFDFLSIIYRVDKKPITLYGELFGKGIQKGVDYGEGKRLLFFDMAIDFNILPQDRFLYFMKNWRKYTVPCLEVTTLLKNALDFDVNFSTKINPIDGNLCEGVVIKPYIKVYKSIQGSVFYIKKKNDNFKEKSSQKVERIIDPTVEKYSTIFKTYITDNRIESVFSQIGKIETSNQLGKYIVEILNDAKEDFLKDYDIDKVHHRQIFNVGGLIANKLRDYL